jgi:hypothetical protein
MTKPTPQEPIKSSTEEMDSHDKAPHRPVRGWVGPEGPHTSPTEDTNRGSRTAIPDSSPVPRLTDDDRPEVLS